MYITLKTTTRQFKLRIGKTSYSDTQIMALAKNCASGQFARDVQRGTIVTGNDLGHLNWLYVKEFVKEYRPVNEEHAGLTFAEQFARTYVALRLRQEGVR